MLGSSSTTTIVPFWSCTTPIVPFLSLDACVDLTRCVAQNASWERQVSKRLVRAISPSQRALGFTVRSCVSRSTATRPNVGR